MPSSRKVSIFNDVLGPVMRGPSSSHTAASVRIAQFVRYFTNGEFNKVLVEYDPDGALATTAGPQGSNIGLAAGLIGLSCRDEKLKNSLQLLQQKGIEFQTKVAPIPSHKHPNTYKISTYNSANNATTVFVAISLGGGAFEVVSINEYETSIRGESFLAFFKVDEAKGNNFTQKYHSRKRPGIYRFSELRLRDKNREKSSRLFLLESDYPWEDTILEDLESDSSSHVRIPCIMPVPVLSNARIPFSCTKELKKCFEENINLSLWELAAFYECSITGMTTDQCLEKAKELVKIYRDSIHEGLRGTSYSDRILGAQSVELVRCMNSQIPMLNLGTMNKVLTFISSFMEMKSSFGLIIAGPTAGSCACVPGCILGFGSDLNKSDLELAKALLICGLIGCFIAINSTFAAEEGGCQAECGAAGSMAAAGLVYFMGGTVEQSITASSLTLQSLLGMVCDPIGNRVEAPCLLRNIAAASTAASSANLALASYSSVIPFDEVLNAHWEICKAMPRSLRCTGLAGLAAQPTSRKLEKMLEEGAGCNTCSRCAPSISSVW